LLPRGLCARGECTRGAKGGSKRVLGLFPGGPSEVTGGAQGAQWRGSERLLPGGPRSGGTGGGTEVTRGPQGVPKGGSGECSPWVGPGGKGGAPVVYGWALVCPKGEGFGRRLRRA
jgi:hypothetical protein